jgi:hypothetical protein
MLNYFLYGVAGGIWVEAGGSYRTNKHALITCQVVLTSMNWDIRVYDYFLSTG